MKKILLAVSLATFAILATMTGAKAAPVTTGDVARYMDQDTTMEGFTRVDRGHRVYPGPPHNCRVHGACGGGFTIGPGGIFVGPGYSNFEGSYTRSCRRVRRFCRDEWGGGRRYRRCVRRRDCRP